MDYATVFKNSGRIIWRYKLLWVVGLLLMSGSIPGLVVGHLYLRFVFSFPSRLVNALTPEEFFQPILDIVLNPTIVIGGALLFVLVFAVVWILSAIGEAALIRSVADYDDGRSHSLREMLAAGTKLLARIIAIDTVIFFPLFLILLIQLLTVGGGMIGGILLLTQPGADPNDLVPIGLGVLSVVLFLTLLSLPVAILSFMFRLIAFRSAVLEDLPTRPSIRQAWSLIRSKIGQIIVVFLLLYAVGYVVGMVTSLLVTPFAVGGSMIFLNPLTRGQFPQQGTIDAFLLVMALVSLVSLVPNLFYRIFSSAVWTMTYREWQGEQAPRK